MSLGPREDLSEPEPSGAPEHERAGPRERDCERRPMRRILRNAALSAPIRAVPQAVCNYNLCMRTQN